MTFSLGSIALGATGISLAASATAFAAYMIADQTRTPTFSGAEHLMIFARPASQAAGKVQARHRDEASPIPLDVDDMPVGSIKPRAGGPEGGRSGESAQDMQDRTEVPVRGVFNGKALVEIPSGFALAEPGSNLPGLGHVLAIEARNGRWVVVTTRSVASADR
jgi:hypothetical protein